MWLLIGQQIFTLYFCWWGVQQPVVCARLVGSWFCYIVTSQHITIHPEIIGTCHLCPGEAVVQDARAKAAAAGVPSSEPMTLQELEAIQAKMAAKKQHSTTNMGEHFLNQDAHSVIDATFRNVATNTNDVEAGKQTDDNSAISSSSNSNSIVSGQREASDAKPDTEAEAMSNRNAMQELTAGGPEADGNSLAEEQEEQEEQVDIADVKVCMVLSDLSSGVHMF